MRSFFHKDFQFQHKYPIKVWSAGIIEDIPYLVSFDGATMRQINLYTKKISHSFDYHHLNAFSICYFMSTNIYKYENLFLLVKNQRFIEIYDPSLKHIPQFDHDAGSAVITVHWHKQTDRLFICGTNGWLRCLHVTTQHKVTEFVAQWELLWEIRSTSDWITSLAHDDFTQILYGAVEDSVYAWDLNTGDFKYRLPQMHNKFKICQVYVDAESSVVITSGLDGYIRTWNIKELECKNLNSFEVAPEGHLSFSMIGRQIVTIGKDRIIKFYGISDSALRCSVELADPSKKVDYDEIINPPLVVLETPKGSICITSYKEQIQTAVLYSAPEDILSTDSTISSMDFDEKENNLLCLCSNNFIVASREKGKSTTIDLDVPNTNVCKRCSVSEVLCFVVSKDILYAGFKNGSVKCINLRKKECIMLDQVPLEEQIEYITIVHGLFLFNHPICGEVSPIKTSNQTPFIVGYTNKGNINVWCARCYTHLLSFEIGKKPITCMKLVPEKSLILISAQKTLTIYRVNAYDFVPLGEITTSGNQFVTSFELTKEMELIAGTSSGEIMIIQIEETSEEFHFHLKHHLGLDSGVFKIHFNSFIGKPVVCLTNGSVFAMNQQTAKIIARTNHVDAEPLTAVYFKYNLNEGKVGAYLAFGSRIHFAPVDTYEEPVVVKEEEEEEEEKKKEEEDDENEDKAERIIKYYEESQLNISRLVLMAQKEQQDKKKKKKKNTEYIPEMGSSKIPQTQDVLPNQRSSSSQNKKLTVKEVMQKNRNAINEALGIYDYSRPSSAKKKATYYKSKHSSKASEASRSEYDENQLNLTLTPFFYTENTRVMTPSLKKVQDSEEDESSRASSSLSSTRSVNTSRSNYRIQVSSSKRGIQNLTATEKSLVYNERVENGFQAIIDENENVQRTTPDYIPPGGRFILKKLKKENVKAPTIIRKIFVGPPQSSRILFNDPSTLNGLSFFDPRGFQTRLSAEGSELTSKSTSLESANEEEEESNNNEEEEEASQSDGEKDIFPFNKPRMSELDRRRLLKKRRISITQMMTAPSKRSKTAQQIRKRYKNDSQFKPKQQIQTPKTPPPVIKNDHNAKLQHEPLNTKPPILITNAHIERKDKPEASKQQSENLSRPPSPRSPRQDENPPNPPSTDDQEETKEQNKDKQQQEEAPKVEPESPPHENENENPNENENESHLAADSESSKRSQSESARSETVPTEIPEPVENIPKNEASSDQSTPQSPKHVQFVIPAKPSKNDLKEKEKDQEQEKEDKENKYSDSDTSSVGSEIQVDLPIIDIKLRRDMHQKRRKLKDQPIHIGPMESTLTSYIKNKIPEHEKYTKQKPQAPPPRMPPQDENESVKASMASPNSLSVSKSKLSASSSTSSFVDKKQGKSGKKNKKKRSRTASSSGMSEASSTADSSESNMNALSQDDTIILPETKSPKLEAISKDEEQARINQERRKRILDMFSQEQNYEKEEVEVKKEDNVKEVKHFYPQLENLQKFWELKMISPVLPFECGNPNTAKYGEGTVFDDDMESVNPVLGFHLFSGTEKNGVNDLVRRFQKISAFNSGEREDIDDVFEADTKEDILSNLPSFKRRLSF